MDVVNAHIQHIEAVNPHLNAVVVDRFHAARAEAEAADAALARGDAVGPLHGVPCTIKECFAVQGMPQTSGLLSRKGLLSKQDAPTVARLRAAGAIVMGVTNLSELCMWMESDNAVYGRTNNPYDPSRIVGGSSGGEGAIVGAGGSPFGLGSDVGGSIRMPAFFCGVFGHKASPGLIPNDGQFPCTAEEVQWMLASGPLCRRAEDLAPLVRVLAGRDDAVGDVGAVDFGGMTVIDVGGDGRHRVAPALKAAQRRAALALEARGAVLSRRRFEGFRDALQIWSVQLGTGEGGAAFRSLLGKPRRRDLLPHLFRPLALGGTHTLPAVLLGLIEDVAGLSDAAVRRTLDASDRLRDDLLEAMGDGVLLFPSHPVPAPTHRNPLIHPFRWVFTAVFNALGLPATQIPLGLDSDGLPLGVQVVGPPGADHRLIAVAQALQADMGGWIPPWKTNDASDEAA